MSIKVPDEGKNEMLNLILADSPNWRVKLNGNVRPPGDGDHITDYTEVTFPGYNGNRPPTNWVVGTSAFGQVQFTADPITFQRNAGVDLAHPAVTVAGYYVLNSTNKVLWAEALNTMSPPPATFPVTLSALGDSITITPTLIMASFF